MFVFLNCGSAMSWLPEIMRRNETCTPYICGSATKKEGKHLLWCTRGARSRIRVDFRGHPMLASTIGVGHCKICVVFFKMTCFLLLLPLLLPAVLAASCAPPSVCNQPLASFIRTTWEHPRVQAPLPVAIIVISTATKKGVASPREIPLPPFKQVIVHHA